MFRLLIICIVFLLLYLGFSIVETLDSQVVLTLYDYHVETTFFSLLTFGILSLLISFIVIKILILIIDLPSKIQDIFTTRKINNNQYSLVRSISEYIIDNKSKAGSIARKISLPIKKENRELYTLILANTEEEISKKIAYFEELETSKQFTFFAAKNLAILFYRKSFYQEAEGYASKAYNLNEFDSDVIAILINCYGKLALWEKFTFVVAKLAKLNKSKFAMMSSEIAEYYLSAAKMTVENNNTEIAIDYLELALSLNCIIPAILELYLTLNSNINNNKKIKILKNAFNAHPSLEIVKIFKKFTELLNYQIYEELTSELNIKEHLILFLAIAAYLDLPDKIASLKASPKLLSFSEA